MSGLLDGVIHSGRCRVRDGGSVRASLGGARGYGWSARARAGGVCGGSAGGTCIVAYIQVQTCVTAGSRSVLLTCDDGQIGASTRRQRHAREGERRWRVRAVGAWQRY